MESDRQPYPYPYPLLTANVHEEGGSEVVGAGGGERGDERVGRLGRVRARARVRTGVRIIVRARVRARARWTRVRVR